MGGLADSMVPLDSFHSLDSLDPTHSMDLKDFSVIVDSLDVVNFMDLEDSSAIVDSSDMVTIMDLKSSLVTINSLATPKNIVIIIHIHITIIQRNIIVDAAIINAMANTVVNIMANTMVNIINIMENIINTMANIMASTMANIMVIISTMVNMAMVVIIMSKNTSISMTMFIMSKFITRFTKLVNTSDMIQELLPNEKIDRSLHKLPFMFHVIFETILVLHLISFCKRNFQIPRNSYQAKYL